MFDHALALQPCGFERLFARDIGAFDFLLGNDFGLTQHLVGIRTFRLLGGDLDGAILLSDFHHALLLDLQDLAGAGRGDALFLDLEFGRDALAFHRVTALDLGGFERLAALDFQPPRFKLGGDAFRRDGLFLGNAGSFGGFAR